MPIKSNVEIVSDCSKTTFILSIKFRQNASWQGRIEWLEGGQECSFRSPLEMAMLMQEAWKAGSSD